jgi:hypothetical protein
MLNGTRVAFAYKTEDMSTALGPRVRQPTLLGTPKTDHLYSAGGHLRDARSVELWGMVAGWVAGAVAGALVADMQQNPEHKPGAVWAIPIGLSLTSVICNIVAWYDIGEAGTHISQAVSDSLNATPK